MNTSIQAVLKWFKKDEEYHEQSLELRERILNFDTEFVMSYYGLLKPLRDVCWLKKSDILSLFTE